MKLPIARLALAFVIAFVGIAFSVYAGRDDSPGGVLLGLLFVVVAVALAVRGIRRTR